MRNLGGGRGQTGEMTQETNIGWKFFPAVGLFDNLHKSNSVSGLNFILQVQVVTVFITGSFVAEVQAWVAMETDTIFPLEGLFEKIEGRNH